MSGFLPRFLVLLVGLILGADDRLFVRWIQHATETEPIADSPSDERDDEVR